MHFPLLFLNGELLVLSFVEDLFQTTSAPRQASCLFLHCFSSYFRAKDSLLSKEDWDRCPGLSLDFQESSKVIKEEGGQKKE